MDHDDARQAPPVWETLMTLYGDFLRDDHRRMHKWFQYFPAYEAHFARFRNRHLTIFEIGVGEGGSLDQWRGYFGPFATIVGIDIYPRCRQLEGDQIHIRIGSQTDRAFLASIIEEFGPPDIVIDDGSHLQHHIQATFDFLYPLVAKNGVYLVEDLHAAYWPDHGGGLRRPGSFIETAKDLVDQMHANYVSTGAIRSRAGERTTSVHFYDSVVVFEVGEARTMGSKTTGQSARFDGAWAPEGMTKGEFNQVVEAALSDIEKNGPRWAAVIEILDSPPPPRASSRPISRPCAPQPHGSSRPRSEPSPASWGGANPASAASHRPPSAL
jgi:hypothetical protein